MNRLLSIHPAEQPPSPAILNLNSSVHGEGKEQVDRWRGLESLDSDSVTAAGGLLQQDLLCGRAAGAELEMLEERADLWGWWPGQAGPIPWCFSIPYFTSLLE